MDDLADAIHHAATIKIRAHERRLAGARAETTRRQRRSSAALPKLDVRRPDFWDYDESHDPFPRAFPSCEHRALDRFVY